MQGDSELSNMGHIGIILAEAPDNDLRPVPLSVHTLEKIVELTLQPPGTQLANKVKKTTLHNQD